MPPAVKRTVIRRLPVDDRDARDRLLQVAALVAYRLNEIRSDDERARGISSVFGREPSKREVALLQTIGEIAGGV